MFLVKSFVTPPDNFNIYDYDTFASTTDRITRSSASSRLRVKYAKTSLTRHSFFNRVVRLWNSLPHIDLSLSLLTIKQHLIHFLWQHFLNHFESDNPCSFSVPVLRVTF